MDATLEEFVREIVQNRIIANWQYWLLIGGVTLVASAVANCFSGYFKKWGEDKAALKLLDTITRTVEEIKSDLQTQQTLRFAALEKRLQVHQDAFGLCRKMLRVIRNRDALGERLSEMQEFFDAKGLYLEPEARTAFWNAYGAATEYSVVYADPPRDMKKLKENWTEIKSAIDVISQSVGLPLLKNDVGISTVVES